MREQRRHTSVSLVHSAPIGQHSIIPLWGWRVSIWVAIKRQGEGGDGQPISIGCRYVTLGQLFIGDLSELRIQLCEPELEWLET